MNGFLLRWSLRFARCEVIRLPWQIRRIRICFSPHYQTQLGAHVDRASLSIARMLFCLCSTPMVVRPSPARYP